MKVSYEGLDVKLNAAASAIRARVAVQNRSAMRWRPDEGFALGFHIFDAENGTLIVDGARVRPPNEIGPGERMTAEFDIPLPSDLGRYHVFVSPLQEERFWFYEKNSPFLLIDVLVRNENVHLMRVCTMTRPRLRREQWLRSLGRAFRYPVQTIWRNRSLIRTMVRRDVLGRYRGSFGGVLWTVLNPLLLMITYFFVFGVVLRARFGSDPSRASFALYFLAGMLPWLAFSEAAGRAPTVLLEHRTFVKRLVFAVETLPVNLVVAGLVSEAFALALFTLFLFIARGGVAWSIAWLPVILVPQIFFTAGICWFLAALGVFIRDLGQVIGFLLTLWFFLTPICYPEASLPPGAAPLVALNPMFVLVRAYRDIFLEARAPAFGPLWKLWLLSTVVFVAGHAWFYKLRKSFADVI